MEGALKDGYVRLGLHADVPMEDARSSGAMNRDADIDEVLWLFGEQKAGIVEVSVSYAIRSAGTGKGKTGGKVAVHIVTPGKGK